MDEAAAQYEEALRLEPRYLKAHQNLAAILTTRGRVAEAIEHLRRAVALDPHAVEHRAGWPNLLIEAGRLDEAEVLIDDGISRQSDAGVLQTARALLRRKQGRLSEAQDAFRAALQLDPNLAETYRQLGD